MKVFAVDLKSANREQMLTDNVTFNILDWAYMKIRVISLKTLRKFYTLTPNVPPRYVIWSEIVLALFFDYLGTHRTQL